MDDERKFKKIVVEFCDPEEFAPLDEDEKKLLSSMREVRCPLDLKYLRKLSRLPERAVYQATILLRLHGLVEIITGAGKRECFRLVKKKKSD